MRATSANQLHPDAPPRPCPQGRAPGRMGIRRRTGDPEGSVRCRPRPSTRSGCARPTATSWRSSASASRCQPGEFFTHARPVGLGQDDDAAADRRLRARRLRAPSSSTASTSPRSPPYERDVNTVFQDYALFPHMTSLENVAYGLHGQGRRPQRERAARAAEALRMVRLADLGAAQADPALRRPAPARRARARAREPPARAAARRAARRAGPQAAPGDAARAEAHPARAERARSRSSTSRTTRTRR